ncbi:MAG: hypothetical protein F4151_00505 [Gammaproteobacteria bacterium]|nr:hypothetical protein [Gammaproteobacteria bacterium]
MHSTDVIGSCHASGQSRSGRPDRSQESAKRRGPSILEKGDSALPAPRAPHLTWRAPEIEGERPMRRFTFACIQGLAILAANTACAAATPEMAATPAPAPAMQSAETSPPADAAAEAGALPRVTIVATGGTIAGVSDTRTSFQSYRAGSLGIAEMLSELRPQIDEVADVTTVQFGNRPSGGYAIADFFDLTLAVEEALETADAVVVTSGTGSMDEFVYWRDLTGQSR